MNNNKQSTIGQQFEIVYNLDYYEGFSFLPTAFITTRNEEGELTYIQRKVSADTMVNYRLDFEPIHEILLKIVDSLQISALEKKYNKVGKRPKPLSKLIENSEVKKNIIQFVDTQLDSFLKKVVHNHLPICLDARRKDWIRDVRLKTNSKSLIPNLNFKHKDNGITYNLELSNGKRIIHLLNRRVQVITNQPAWLIINGIINRAIQINGNMVKPFVKKDEVFIRQSFVKEYFQKFIMKIAAKATINAEGFEIVKYEKLLTSHLAFRYNFMTKEYGLELTFDYGKVQFGVDEKINRKSKLEFNTLDDIVIHQYQRDFSAERNLLNFIATMGLVRGSGKTFHLLDMERTTPYLMLEWLIKNASLLKSNGISLGELEFEDKKISTAIPELQLNLKQINDWFDIYGVIEVDGYTIPFYSLAGYIRDYNRLYPLPNGTFFLIPEEWMERYQALFQIAKVRKNGMRLNKSQFPILQNLSFDKADEETQEALAQDFKDIDYSTPKSLKAKLRPYQIEGVKWLIHLYHNQLGACLADDMGLGKTLQTIAMLLYAKEQKAKHAENGKAKSTYDGKQLSMFNTHLAALEDFSPLNSMVILPASLVFNWEEEVKKFAPHLNIYRHVGSKRHKKAELLTGFDILLTTYHTALKDINLLQDLVFEYVVLDESQQIKNKDSKIFKAINKLQANHKISLSGTPIENSLSDLWSQMQFINPELLGNFTFFKKEFIIPIERQNDEIQKERLKSLIAPYLLRRTKESVAKDLPDLTYRVFYSEMSTKQKKLYEKEKSAARNYLLENFNKKDIKFSNLVLNTLMKLRQIANHPLLVSEEYDYPSGKFADILHHLETIQKGGHKTLIFSQFVSHLKLFKAHFQTQNWQYSWLTGGNTQKERQRAIKSFQNEEAIKAFLISLKAGGTGLNLTAADYVFITDPWWNPSAERQAIARAHRIGQTKNVIAIKFITKDSIEEKILKLQERKRQLAEDIIENNEKIQFNKKDLAFLLE
jgi:non-specific serine/threonine protein kinase